MSTETILMTLRHGVTEYSRLQKTCGRTDAPLNEDGRRQAGEAQVAFRGRSADAVISSPLLRAVETACIVANVDRSRVRIDPDLIERDFGRLEGLIRAEVLNQFPSVRYQRIAGIFYSLNPPDGESFESVRERAGRFLARVLRDGRGRRVLVSSHQVLLQQLHGLLLGQGTMDCLSRDVLYLELNRFLIAADGRLLEHAGEQLCSNQYPSY